MISYFIIIFVPTILYFIDENIASKGGLFKKAAIIFLVAASALRYGFGVDYYVYFDAFTRMENGIMTDQFEWGYKFLNVIIAKLGMPFHFLLFIIAGFNLVLVYKAIEDNVNKYKWLSIFFFLVYFDMFFYSLAAIRQSVVLSIVLYTFKHIVHKNFKKYVCWMLFGSLFHNSALFMIPVYFLYQYLRKQNFWLTTIVMVVITVLYIVLVKFIYLIQPFISDTLSYYLFTFDNAATSYDFIDVVSAEIALIGWIYISCILRNKIFKEQNNESYIYFLGITILLVLKIFQYMHYYSLIPRMQLYFYCIAIFAIPNFVKAFSPKLRPLLNLIIIVLFIIKFVFSYYEVNEDYLYYYESFMLVFSQW